MVNGIPTAQVSTQPRCEVCDNVITYPDFLMTKHLDYVVCQSFDCRRIMNQKSTMTPLFFKSHLEFNKKIISQRRQRDAERKKHIDEINEKEHKEHQEVVRSVYSDHSELSEENTQLLVIPSGYTTLYLTSSERLKKYIDHLSSIINEADEYLDASEVVYDEHHDAYRKRIDVDQRLDDMPQLRSISDNLCCMCKGGCCASGKEHAYLSVFSMRRYMDENPELIAEEVFELYLSKISLVSIEGSCINQTKTGCALPRELRSDICNAYYCDALKSYQKKAYENNKLDNIVVIQRSYNYWNRFDSGVNNKIVDVALLDEYNQYEIKRLNDLSLK